MSIPLKIFHQVVIRVLDLLTLFFSATAFSSIVQDHSPLKFLLSGKKVALGHSVAMLLSKFSLPIIENHLVVQD